MATTSQEAVSQAVSTADAYFSKPQHSDEMEAAIRKMTMIPVESRRQMEELQRTADAAKLDLEKVENRRTASLFNMGANAGLMTLCSALVWRGYLASDPMSSLFREHAKSIFVRRLGNSYSIIGMVGILSALPYFPGDYMRFSENSVQRQQLSDKKENALKMRRAIYLEATGN